MLVRDEKQTLLSLENESKTIRGYKTALFDGLPENCAHFLLPLFVAMTSQKSDQTDPIKYLGCVWVSIDKTTKETLTKVRACGVVNKSYIRPFKGSRDPKKEHYFLAVDAKLNELKSIDDCVSYLYLNGLALEPNKVKEKVFAPEFIDKKRYFFRTYQNAEGKTISETVNTMDVKNINNEPAPDCLKEVNTYKIVNVSTYLDEAQIKAIYQQAKEQLLEDNLLTEELCESWLKTTIK